MDDPSHHAFHDVRLSGNGCEWEASSHSFGEHRNIRGHAVACLSAAQSHTEAGDDLIENQNDAVGIAEFAHAFQEARFGRNHTTVAGHGLKNDRCYLLGLAIHCVRQHGEIVVGLDYQVVPDVLRLSGALIENLRGVMRASLIERRRDTGEDVVGPAVVVPFELHDLGPSRVSTSQAHGDLVDLCSGHVETDPLGAGDQFGEPMGKIDLRLVDGCEGLALIKGFSDGL